MMIDVEFLMTAGMQLAIQLQYCTSVALILWQNA